MLTQIATKWMSEDAKYCGFRAKKHTLRILALAVMSRQLSDVYTFFLEICAYQLGSMSSGTGKNYHRKIRYLYDRKSSNAKTAKSMTYKDRGIVQTSSQM